METKKVKADRVFVKHFEEHPVTLAEYSDGEVHFVWADLAAVMGIDSSVPIECREHTRRALYDGHCGLSFSVNTMPTEFALQEVWRRGSAMPQLRDRLQKWIWSVGWGFPDTGGKQTPIQRFGGRALVRKVMSTGRPVDLPEFRGTWSKNWAPMNDAVSPLQGEAATCLQMFNGWQVRTVKKDGETCFVVRDILLAVGYVNITCIARYTRHCCRELFAKIDGEGGERWMVVISREDVVRLLGRLTRPTDEFRDWLDQYYPEKAPKSIRAGGSQLRPVCVPWSPIQSARTPVVPAEGGSEVGGGGGAFPERLANNHADTADIVSAVEPAPGLIAFGFEGHQVRTVTRDGKPYFVAKDVAECLGYPRPRDAVRYHCKASEITSLHTPGGEQKLTIIPESDVFRLINGSTLPAAERFKDWVNEEVLPSIRKTGRYVVPQAGPETAGRLKALSERFAEGMTAMARTCDRLTEENLWLKQELQELRP